LIADKERSLDNAIVADYPPPSTPPLPVENTSLPPPPPPPAHRAVRRLSLGNVQADTPPRRSPSPPRAASPAAEEPPASPVVYCSQYRMAEYERQNGPLPDHDKVDGWLRAVQAAHESDGQTPPAAPPKNQYVSDADSEDDSQYVSDADSVDERRRRRRRPSQPVTRIKNGNLYVHKDYTGRLPLCCYVTGLQEGGPHDYYPCYTENDIMWARRVKFHNERQRDS